MSESKRRFVSPSWLGLLSTLLAAGVSTLWVASATSGAAPSASEGTPVAQAASRNAAPEGRLVLVVVDSARAEFFTPAGPMPRLAALAHRPDARLVRVRSCRANFTFPCMQTMFEGRRSPLAGGFSQFLGTASEGGGSHFFAQAARAGRRIALVGNHTLVDTYRRHARWAFNGYATAPDYYTADTRVIERAKELLADPEGPDLLVLHIVGTDKAGHFHREGTEDYLRYWRQADEALDTLAGMLDPRRDTLVVMGDHGHDSRGAHTRSTAALFVGGPLVRFLVGLRPPVERLEQQDLLFALLYPIGGTLPADYEGRVWLPTAPPDASLHGFRAQLGRWLERHGFVGSTLEAQVRAAGMAPQPAPWRSVLPWAGALLAWMFLALSWAAGYDEARTSRRTSVLTITLPWAAALSTWAAAAGWTAASVLLALALGAVLARFARRSRPATDDEARLHDRRRLALGATLLLLALLTGWMARPWMDAFHVYSNETDRFPYEALLFAPTALALGLLAARIRWGSWRWLPFGLFAAVLVAFPSGVYLHQKGPNWVQLGYAGGLIVALASLRHLPSARRREALAWMLAALPFALGVAWQRADSWQWVSGWSGWARLRGAMATDTLALGCALALGVAVPDPRRGVRLVVATAAAWWSAVHWLHLDPGLALAAILPVVATALGWRALGPSWRGRPSSDRLDALAWAVAATIAATLWASLGGFRIWNIDLDFARGWFHGAPTDAQLFATLSLPVLLKYAFGELLLLATARAMLEPDAFGRLGRRTAELLILGAAAAVLQAAGMRLGVQEKQFELALSAAFCLAGGAAVWLLSWPLLQRLPSLRLVATPPAPQTRPTLGPERSAEAP